MAKKLKVKSPTLRDFNAWLRINYPDLYLIVGSYQIDEITARVTVIERFNEWIKEIGLVIPQETALCQKPKRSR